MEEGGGRWREREETGEGRTKSWREIAMGRENRWKNNVSETFRGRKTVKELNKGMKRGTEGRHTDGD